MTDETVGDNVMFGAFRCKKGAEAARALALGSKTASERKHWEHQEKVWRSRWAEAERNFA